MGRRTTSSSPLIASALVALLAVVLHPPQLGADQASGERQGTALAQTPFRVAVDLVNVDVGVVDGQGRFVDDLRADEFEVFDNGKRQEVSAFAMVDVAGERRTTTTAAAPGAIGPPPDVRTNGPAETQGGVYILVLDDLHVQPARSSRAREIARRFVERHLRPGDLAAIVHTSGRSGASQDLTTDRQLLLQAVDRFLGQGLRSSMLDRLEEYDLREMRESDRNDPRFSAVQDPNSMIRAEFARRTLKALTNLGELLSTGAGRRKAVIFVSEGIAYDLQPKAIQTTSGLTAFTGGAFPGVLDEVRQAVRAAAGANIAIYGIDPRGLAAPGDDAIDVTSFPSNPLLGITPDAVQKEVTQAQDSLRVLSDLTGGAASVASNEFDTILDRIVADAHRYYLLGYRPEGKRNDGRYHAIEVRVKRPGLQVRARRGYIARAGTPAPAVVTEALEPSAPLRDALNSPLPVAGVPLRAFAAPFKSGGGASVSVGIEIDADRFAFKEEAGLYTDTIDVAIVAIDEQGRFTAGDRYTISLRLKRDTYAAVLQQGVRALFRLELPGGRYQLRAAAHEAGRNAVGSVTYDIEVPSFEAAPIALSGLVLTTPEARKRPTARNDRILSQTLPTPPTTVRAFRASETVTTFFEVYGGAAPVDVRVEASIRRRDGSAVVTRPDQASAQEIQNGGGGVGFAIPLSLSGLDSGGYILRVEVRPEDAVAPRVSRELPIEVIGSP